MRPAFPLLLILLALPLAVLTAQPGGVPPAAGGRAAGELLTAGEAAFNAGQWQSAADAFREFITNFGSLDGTAATLVKVKPLLAICHVRLGQFEQALPLLDEALKIPALDPKQRADLLFFSGLANLRTGKPDTARKQLGKIFADAKVERSRRMEALVLGGMTYVIEKNWKESIKFFQTHGGEISAYSPEAGARARILQLHALMQDGRPDEALALVVDLRGQLEEVRQVVTFSSLMIELGAKFLDAGAYHKAIGVLGRVPAKREIERLQNARLAEAATDLEMATLGGNSVRAAQLQSGVDEMKRELAAFADVPQFDSAARLRLAGAYFELTRTREGCLILDQMVRQMEPDAIVESATASLLRGWMSLERYSRAVRTADLYLERCGNLPEKPNLPDVMFLRAQALEGQFQYQDAADGYREVAGRFADHPIAARARFMAAYNILQLENYREAGNLLEKQAESMKKGDEMWEHVVFWRGMAFYFDQQWDECRARFTSYLEAVGGDASGGEYADDARFRIGYSYFSEARYPEAITALKDFATTYPASEWLAEALLTLGDSLAAEGDLDEAAAAYARIGVEAAGFHDEGWMKRGNLFKARKDPEGMKKLFTEFLEKRPDSPRIAEALQSLGWIAKQEGRVEDARKIYWEAVARFGDDIARPGLEDIFLGLQTFYTGANRIVLETRLGDALAEARAGKKRRLATRLGWALAQSHLSGRGAEALPPEERARKSREALVALVPEIEAKDTAPRILADVGDALAVSGKSAEAGAMYEGLRKWWPRAPERDRAFAGLGFLALGAGDEPAALGWFERFEKSSVMPKTAPDDRGVSIVEGELGGKVALARARMLATREPDKSLDLLLAVQRTKSMPARVRAEAFIEAGRLHVARGRQREALPYFEQVYLLFNRFPDLVAAAYFERGQTLEKLSLPDKAREVYSELALREDLSALEPAKLGLARAEALGGVLQPVDPAGGLIPPSPGPR